MPASVEQRRAYNRKSYQKHREQRLQACREYRQANAEAVQKRTTEYSRNRRAQFPELGRAASRRWRKTHPEKQRAATRKWSAENADHVREHKEMKRLIDLQDPGRRLRSLVRAAKHRARARGVEFEGGLGDFLAANPPRACACCKGNLDYSTAKGHGRKASASLDRVQNDRGYIIPNVQVICMRCNTRKGSMTVADLRQIIAYVEAHQTDRPKY